MKITSTRLNLYGALRENENCYTAIDWVGKKYMNHYREMDEFISRETPLIAKIIQDWHLLNLILFISPKS